MGLRGPKPAGAARLQELRAGALAWARFLLSLRDGKIGLVYLEKYGAPRAHGAVEPVAEIVKFAVAKILPAEGGNKGADSLGWWLAAATDAAGKGSGDEFRFIPPTTPCTDGWTKLMGARSAAQVRDAADVIGAWRLDPMGLQDNFQQKCVQTIRDAAAVVVRAKRLPSYPRSKRPTSADSRLLFLAKILAGADAGLRPLSALKRLGGLKLPMETSREFAESMRRYQQAPPTGGATCH